MKIKLIKDIRDLKKGSIGTVTVEFEYQIEADFDGVVEIVNKRFVEEVKCV